MGIGFKTKAGGGMFVGRLHVTTMRAVVGKPERAESPPSTHIVIRGRDAAGEKQEVWLGVGEKPGKLARFKPDKDGKDLRAVRDGDMPADGSKWGVFARSLGGEQFSVGKTVVQGCGFPQSRLEQLGFAALDNCTIELDTIPMNVGAAILLDRQRQGKEPPVAYIVTAFKLPDKAGKGDGEDGEDEAGADDDSELLGEDDGDGGGGDDADEAATELKGIVLAALKKAGKPVEIKALKAGLAKKYVGHQHIDKWIDALQPKTWANTVSGWGVVVDKKAGTIAMEE